MFFTYGIWSRKYGLAIKKSKFNFFVEYPIWVSIKKTLTDKLAVDGQSLSYCLRFEENVQKPLRKADSWKVQKSLVFGRFLHMGNSDLRNQKQKCLSIIYTPNTKFLSERFSRVKSVIFSAPYCHS